MPYVEYNTCLPNLPEDFRPAITYDKICVGFRHKGKSLFRQEEILPTGTFSLNPSLVLSKQVRI